jgi:hypothetical protein
MHSITITFGGLIAHVLTMGNVQRAVFRQCANARSAHRRASG